MIIRETVLSIGENKSMPRIWLEGKYLEKAGFTKGVNIKITWLEKQIIIQADKEGSRIVSERRERPIIDINNEKIKEIFDQENEVHVIVRLAEILITSTKKSIKRQNLLSDKSCGSLFSGGGLLDLAVEQENYNVKWAIEKNTKYADIYQLNHSGLMYNMCISDIFLGNLEPIELLIGGIPCEPFSIARRNKDDISETIDLSMFFLMVVEAVNPRKIILEEVPQYINSEIGIATIQALKRMGYNVEYKLFKGTDFNIVETRKRLVIVASMDKIKFPEIENYTTSLKDILLDPEDPRCEWFSETDENKKWIFEHWKNQKAKGNNFTSQIITYDSKTVQAITKRYFAQQAGNPIVKHPAKELYRWLTIDEVKRIKGVSESYQLENKTTGGEVLGQGVLVKMFRKIVECLK